jgi:hypothetical protein
MSEQPVSTIYLIGHKIRIDSICSSIAFAAFKRL